MAKNKPNKTIRFVFRTQSNIYDAYFAKIGNVFHKNAPSQILDWVLKTPLSIVKRQERGALAFFKKYIKLCGSVMKFSTFYQKYIQKRHIYAFLNVRRAISAVLKQVPKCTIAKERSLA